MAQSPSLRLFNGFNSSRDKQPLSTIQDTGSTQPADNVQGWLMNLHTYRDPDASNEKNTIIVDADNNCIPTESRIRNGRPESIASEDSVNLDELINANFTVDMDDETDLPDLADLDLDDSADDFWKMDNNEQPLSTFDTGFDEFLSKSVADNYELDWSPSTEDQKKPTTNTNNHTHTLKTSLPVTISSEFASRYKKNRSDSIGSENSLTSQSTITQYAKYGLTPMIYPSESSSSSSRSLSRLSNYSTASSSTTSGIPLPRSSTNNTSSNNNNGNGSGSGGIPTPSRSYTTREKNNSNNNNKGHLSPPGSTQRTQLAKRASHIPAPATTTNHQNQYHSPPSPQRTISSSSASSTNNNNLVQRIPNSPTTKRIPQRASHIPTVRESIHRPGSPLNNSGRSSTTPSRMAIRSPTPGGPRNSLFNNTNTDASTKPREEKRGMSPTATRPSSLRPPGSVSSGSGSGSGVRSISRIGTAKKS